MATKAKVSSFDLDGRPNLIMTSGLRSIRDKVVRRLGDELVAPETRPDRLLDLADAYGRHLRDVRAEDGASLATSGLTFDLHTIIAGSLSRDDQVILCHVYPEGNWIVATPDAPTVVIGRPIQSAALVRLVDSNTSLSDALRVGYLAFEVTRSAVADVDLPIDVVTIDAAGTMAVGRFGSDAVAASSRGWTDGLRRLVREVPIDWAAPLVSSDRGALTSRPASPR